MQCFNMGMMLLLLPQAVQQQKKTIKAMCSNLWLCNVHNAFSNTSSSMISVGKDTDGNLGQTEKNS